MYVASQRIQDFLEAFFMFFQYKMRYLVGAHEKESIICVPGRISQSVTCLTADPRVAISIQARSHTFMEIDHEVISTGFPPPFR